MRASVLALTLIAAVGAGAWAYSSGNLPPALSGPIDAGLAALVRGESRTAATAPKPASPPAAGQGGGANGGAAGAGPRRPPPVEAATASTEKPSVQIRSVGSLMADESVQIAAEQSGRIVAINFSEGQAVTKGDELVKLDDALIAGELGQLKARLDLANANYARAQSLSRTGSGTAKTLEEAAAERLTAQSLINLLQSRLDKTSIRAPFDGVTGLRKISVGAYVQPGEAIAGLEKIDVLKVEFSVPERNLADISLGMPVVLTVDAYPNRTFDGEIYAIDPLVDVNGRALRVRARLANPQGELRPGLFARVTVEGKPRGEVVMIPEGAVVPQGTGAVVFRIADGKAQKVPVILGQRRNGRVEVASGLSAGDVVVVAGQMRLRGEGGPVSVVTLDGAAAPAPAGDVPASAAAPAAPRS